MKEALKIIRELSPEAKQVFCDILMDGDLCLAMDHSSKDGWPELMENSLVNTWEDDSGFEYCEIGTPF